MLLVTPEQMTQWRSELADYPDVLRALDAIEDCEGDVEDAAIGLAIQAGLEPDNSDRWLISLAKRYRTLICQLLTQSSSPVETSTIVRYLVSDSPCPALMVLPVAVAANEHGLEAFCRGLIVEERTGLGEH